MFEWINERIDTPEKVDLERAQNYQNQLTKPQGSLGEMESIAIRIAALQKCLKPSVNRAQIIVFAADHGIAEEGVSAFPQAVTAEMIRNFSTGGAAISVLAKQHNLPFHVVNLGLISRLEKLEHVADYSISSGSRNFIQTEAMTMDELAQAFAVGKIKVDQATQDQCELLILGEMGIANTTSATALMSAVSQIDPGEITGSGAGLDNAGIRHKTEIIRQALRLHQHQLDTPLNIMQALGGYEIAAMTAAYLRCAQQGIVALVDGYICTIAALFAVQLRAETSEWLVFAHQSAEKGHKRVLDFLGVRPILQLGMCLGEGSGAAIAYALLKSACLLQSEMASFAQAGVSERHKNE
jgi:nicotinate-nucleotide--dimethylbenzimidazole phosphoribosyltransferase